MGHLWSDWLSPTLMNCMYACHDVCMCMYVCKQWNQLRLLLYPAITKSKCHGRKFSSFFVRLLCILWVYLHDAPEADNVLLIFSSESSLWSQSIATVHSRVVNRHATINCHKYYVIVHVLSNNTVTRPRDKWPSIWQKGPMHTCLSTFIILGLANMSSNE